MFASFRRPLGVLALALLLLRAVAPGPVHACDAAAAEAHEGVPAAVVATPGDHADHHAHHAMAADAAVVTTVAQGAEAPAAPEDDSCDCASWCCCVPTLAGALDVAPPTVVVALSSHDVPRIGVTLVSPGRHDVRLPFPNGPPAA
jgi:hypothetical protein